MYLDPYFCCSSFSYCLRQGISTTKCKLHTYRLLLSLQASTTIRVVSNVVLDGFKQNWSITSNMTGNLFSCSSSVCLWSDKDTSRPSEFHLLLGMVNLFAKYWVSALLIMLEEWYMDPKRVIWTETCLKNSLTPLRFGVVCRSHLG